MKTWYWFVCAAIVLIGVALWPSPAMEPNASPVRRAPPAASNNAVPVRSPSIAKVAALGRADQEHASDIDANLLGLFSYYVAVLDERGVEDGWKKIETELEKRFRPRAAMHAKDLLTRFVAYRTTLFEMEKKDAAMRGHTFEAMRLRMAIDQKVRKQFFSIREATAMFGTEDLRSKDSLMRLEIYNDISLTDAQRVERLTVLDRGLPTDLSVPREAATRVEMVQNTVLQMRANGQSEDAIFQMLAAAFSPEIAMQFAEAERKQASHNTDSLQP